MHKHNDIFDQIHANSKQLLAGYLKPDKSGKGFVCPQCGNGDSGGDGDGLREVPGSKGHYKCFKCGFYGDALDLIGLRENIQGINERIERASEIFNLDTSFLNSPPAPIASEKTSGFNNLRLDALAGKAGPFESKISEARQMLELDIDAINYLKARGISLETAKKTGVGVACSFKGIKKGILLPSSGFGFNVRNIDPGCEKKDRFRKAKGSVDLPFNILSVDRESLEPVFLTEGELDTLSFVEAGADAVALNGQGRESLLLSLKALKIDRPLVMALDSDESGKNGASSLKALLLENGFTVCESQILEDGCKDPNESLIKDKERFKRVVQAEKSRFRLRSRDADDWFDSGSLLGIFADMDDCIENQSGSKPVRVGFDRLDESLDGGLREGLYLLGAVSSVGKTTFAHQMADQIAQNGGRVLFISLEVSPKAMAAKTLSRLSYLQEGQAMTVSEILDMESAHPSIEKIRRANELKDFVRGSFCERVHILDGSKVRDVGKIQACLEEYIRRCGEAPVLIIDYLQFLRPSSGFARLQSDRQSLEECVSLLKELSMKHSIPILAISSFNRDSYRNADSQAGLAAFYGSSSIEYNSDVLMIMENSRETLPEQDLRDVELRIIKNRNGALNAGIHFKYLPKYNYFSETGECSEAGQRLGLRRRLGQSLS